MATVEEDATADGWVPEEEFRANPANEGKKWRTAEDFMDRKSLFSKIDEQHKTIRRLEDGQRALQQHNQNIEKLTRDRLLKELRAEKAEAVKEGDVVKIEELRDRIEEVKEQVVAAPVVQQTGAPPPEFTSWMGDNPWYSTNNEMRQFADAYGVALHNNGKTPAEVLKEVSKKVKEVYPTMFRNPNKESAPPVEKPANRNGAAGKNHKDMEAWEEAIWDRMERAKTPSTRDPKKLMTRDEYVEQLRTAKSGATYGRS